MLEVLQAPTCKASSEYSSTWSCADGLKGTMKAEYKYQWASKNQEASKDIAMATWISVTFKEPYVIYGVRYLGRTEVNGQGVVKQWEVTQEDESKKTISNNFDLQRIDEEVPFYLPNKAYSKTIKFQVKDFYSARNIGGTFVFIGRKIMDEENKDLIANPYAEPIKEQLKDDKGEVVQPKDKEDKGEVKPEDKEDKGEVKPKDKDNKGDI